LIDGSQSVWASDFGHTFPVLNDNDQTVWDLYGTGYIPLNMVLDQDFIIRYKEIGFSESEVRTILNTYLPPR